jgi:lysophospholipase L1-like esterase
MLRRLLFLLTIVAFLIAMPGLLPSPAAAQQRQPLRIAFLGDSLTMGLHASNRSHMYREILARRLIGLHGGSVVSTVIQHPFGLTDDAINRSPPLIESRPDIIVLEIGNHEAFADRVQIDLFDRRYEELLDRLQSTGAVVIAGTLAWLNYAPGSTEYQQALILNQRIRDICARRGIVVADLWAATVFRQDLISRPGDPSAAEPFDGDDLHPNDAGHEALANAFWSAYQRDFARRALAALIGSAPPR